jgi:hypothetical protein
MTEHDGSDQVGHGEASLGEAQSSNPPDDPEMINEGAEPLDADTQLDPPEPEPEAGSDDRPDDPAPAAP